VWSGTLNLPVPSGEWWVAVTSWSGLEGGAVSLSLTEPSPPAHHGSNLATCEVSSATQRPRWVRMRRAHKQWSRVSAVIRSLTGEPITSDRIVVSLEIACRSSED
jgi:hypothetical protein